MAYEQMDILVDRCKEAVAGGKIVKNFFVGKQKWAAWKDDKFTGELHDWYGLIANGAKLTVLYTAKQNGEYVNYTVIKVMVAKDLPMAGKTIAGMPQMEEQMQELPAVPPVVKKDYPPLPTKPVPQVDIHKAQALLDTPIPKEPTPEYWESQNRKKQMASAYSSACSLLSRVMQPNTLPGDITMDTLLDRVKQAAEYIYTRISEAGEEQPPEGEGE